MTQFDPVGKVKMINCPNCDGTGLVENPSKPDCEDCHSSCPECQGTGKLEAKVVKNG
jgi:DnaJ-class molecular chaperone